MRARILLSLLSSALFAGLTVSLPATAVAPGAPVAATVSADEEGLPLPRVMHGEAAIRALGDDADRAARLNGMSQERLLELLVEDPAARLDPGGRLLYADPAATAPHAASQPAAAAYPYAQTFQLHSLPGANRVLYLDFDGHTVSGTHWNSSLGLEARSYAGLNADGTPGFSEAEMDIVQDVWARVAEDFAPLSIDVTTQDPGTAALTRTDGNDTSFGMRALITSDDEAPMTLCSGGCQGIAYVDVFDAPGSASYQPAWAFTATAGNDASFLADIVSHEVGHTLGLDHDGKTGLPYYSGQGVWLPIMGAGFLPLSQFSNGDYGGNNPQDDFAVMAGNGASLRGDDHANSAASGTAVDESAPGAGVISTRTDVDWFTVDQGCSGPLTIDVAPVAVGPNLDAKLTVQTSGGSTIATVDPASGYHPEDGSLVGLGATYSGTQPGGTYRFSVDGVGRGDPTVDGYSDYGSRGVYTVSVVTSCPDAHIPTAPQNVAVTSAANGQGATLTWDPPSAPGGTITGYTVSRSGASPVVLGGSATSHTFTGLSPATGYTFTVAATNATGTGATATVNGTTAGPASAPTGLFVSPVADGEVQLLWSPPVSDGGLPITGYAVRLGGGSPVTVDEFTTWHTFTGLSDGVEYTLGVRALTAFGPGAEATTTWIEGPPDAPASVIATPMSPTSVKVDWEAPLSQGGSAVQSYTVGVQGGSSTVVSASARTHTFTGLAPETAYTFFVRASNSFGPGPENTAFASTPSAPHVPGPVELLAVDAVSRTSVTFSWQYPGDWGEPQLTGFEVRLDLGPWVDVPLEDFPSYTFSDLTAGTSYAFSVRAVNEAGNGQAVTQDFVTNPAARPSAPIIGTASSGVAGGNVTATAKWSAPSSDGGAPITGYKVIALKMSSSGAVLSKKSKTVGPDAHKLVMTLAKGKYRFQVVAINAAGSSKPSARSNLVTAR